MKRPGNPRIAVTMGDPAGIGPEICLSLLAEGAMRDTCRPVVFGDRATLERVAAAIQRPGELRSCTFEEWVDGTGATASELVRSMGWRRLSVVARPGEGVVTLQPIGVSEDVLMTTKVGSYDWPPTVWRNVASTG